MNAKTSVSIAGIFGVSLLAACAGPDNSVREPVAEIPSQTKPALPEGMIPGTTQPISLGDLQGAWWSDFNNPTADFSIISRQVWLDFDSDMHPVFIEDGVLIFDLDPELGQVKHIIVSLDGERLTLRTKNGELRVLDRQPDY